MYQLFLGIFLLHFQNYQKPNLQCYDDKSKQKIDKSALFVVYNTNNVDDWAFGEVKSIKF